MYIFKSSFAHPLLHLSVETKELQHQEGTVIIKDQQSVASEYVQESAILCKKKNSTAGA